MVATIPGSPSPDPWGRFRWASAVAYGALVVGAAGGAVYAVFAGIQTSELYNQWIPMWAAFMVLITGLEILYTNLKTPYLFRNKGFYILDLIYWTLVAIASLIACGGWGAAQLFAPMGWFLINSFLCGLGLFLTVWRRKEVLLGVAAIASAAEANPKVVEGGAADYANGTNGINGDYANAAENGIADSTAKGASSLDKKPNCGRNTLSGFNVFLRFLHVFFLALLANGGIQAALNTSYPPRGTVQTVTLVDGRTRPLHRYCEGPASSLPTIFMDSSGAHGTVDFYPIQTYLVGLGRRVCVYDPPGFGWSGNLLANEFYYYPQSPNAANLHYDSLFEQIGEGGDKKLNFLAWGGGGNPMIRYTRLRPGKVASLGLLDVSVGHPRFFFDALPWWLTARLAARRDRVQGLRRLQKLHARAGRQIHQFAADGQDVVGQHPELAWDAVGLHEHLRPRRVQLELLRPAAILRFLQGAAEEAECLGAAVLGHPGP